MSHVHANLKRIANPSRSPGASAASFSRQARSGNRCVQRCARPANGVADFVILDARSEKAYRECHVSGAFSLPHPLISAETTAFLDRSKLLVVYCWGPACNGAAKACAKLAELGFAVKEMLGGWSIGSGRGRGWNERPMMALATAPKPESSSNQVVNKNGQQEEMAVIHVEG
ncbi:rhodanese-like domain-containing protein [Brevibacillus agri]|uniref:rhodanese-like domain-containing protein n=1 Tax=Brevibacillus agri TaxID=51101 RepID=UPI003D74F670